MLAVFDSIWLWFEAHQRATAWAFGWFMALATAQYIKHLVPADWHKHLVASILQVVATTTGSVIAYAIWPAADENAVVFAVAVGISAPLAYDGLRAAVRWKFPDFAAKLGWDSISQQQDPPPPSCSPP